jgi:hypothetical protein
MHKGQLRTSPKLNQEVIKSRHSNFVARAGDVTWSISTASLKANIRNGFNKRLRVKTFRLARLERFFQPFSKSERRSTLANAEGRRNAKDQEQTMKLNEAQISKILSQFRAQVLAEDHPAAEHFCELFGHHTFFLNAKGLHVLEMLEVPGIEAEDGEVISLADWSDADFTKLTTHHPEPTGLVIRLKEVHH